MKRIICIILFLVLAINTLPLCVYGEETEENEIKETNVYICKYAEDKPKSYNVIIIKDTIYLRGNDISSLSGYKYCGDSLVKDSKNKFIELYSMPTGDNKIDFDFRSVATVYYFLSSGMVRTLGYEYEYQFTEYNNELFFPLEITLYLLHCQWCVDNGIIYVSSLGNNILDFVCKNGHYMLTEEPKYADLIVAGENKVLKFIGEAAAAFDTRLFIPGWGTNSAIEEDFENALLKLNIPDNQVYYDLNSIGTDEVFSNLEDNVNGLSDFVGLGGDIDETINTIGKYIEKSPKFKMEKWNDVTILDVPWLEAKSKQLGRIGDALTIINYGRRIYELSTRANGWNRAFLDEMRLLSKQTSESLDIKLKTNGQNVIDAANNIVKQYEGDNSIVVDNATVDALGIGLDKFMGLTPAGLLVEAVQLANMGLRIFKPGYSNTMDAYALEFDSKTSSYVTSIASFTFISYQLDMLDYGRPDLTKKMSKDYLSELFTATELYVRSSYRQAIYTYEVHKLLSKDSNWINSSEGKYWAEKIKTYQKLLLELEYTVYENSDNTRNYQEKLILVDSLDNMYSDEYGCVRLKLSCDEIKQVDTATSWNEQDAELYLKNMKIPVEIYTFFTHYPDIFYYSDSKEMDINNPNTFWMMLSVYATMEMDDELITSGSKLAERYRDNEQGEMLVLSEEEVQDAVNSMMPGITEFPDFPNVEYEKPYKKDGNYYLPLIDLDTEATRMTDIKINDDGTATAIVEAFTYLTGEIYETYQISLIRNDNINLNSSEPYPYCIESIKVALLDEDKGKDGRKITTEDNTAYLDVLKKYEGYIKSWEVGIKEYNEWYEDVEYLYDERQIAITDINGDGIDELLFVANTDAQAHEGWEEYVKDLYIFTLQNGKASKILQETIYTEAAGGDRYLIVKTTDNQLVVLDTAIDEFEDCSMDRYSIQGNNLNKEAHHELFYNPYPYGDEPMYSINTDGEETTVTESEFESTMQSLSKDFETVLIKSGGRVDLSIYDIQDKQEAISMTYEEALEFLGGNATSNGDEEATKDKENDDNPEFKSYSEVMHKLKNDFGDIEFNSFYSQDESTNFQDYYIVEACGLCYTELIDLNNDGIEELLAVAKHPEDDEYTVFIYTTEKGGVRELSASKDLICNFDYNYINGRHLVIKTISSQESYIDAGFLGDTYTCFKVYGIQNDDFKLKSYCCIKDFFNENTLDWDINYYIMDESFNYSDDFEHIDQYMVSEDEFKSKIDDWIYLYDYSDKVIPLRDVVSESELQEGDYGQIDKSLLIDSLIGTEEIVGQ